MSDNAQNIIDELNVRIMTVKANRIAKELAAILCDKCTHDNQTNIELLVMSSIIMTATVVAMVTPDEHGMKMALMCLENEMRRVSNAKP